MLFSLQSLLMVALHRGFPLGAGKISPTPPDCSLALSRTTRADLLRGTRWGLLVLVRVPGIAWLVEVTGARKRFLSWQRRSHQNTKRVNAQHPRPTRKHQYSAAS